PLTGENIPSTLTVSMQGFSSTPVNVSVTGTSNTKYVLVAGLQDFVSGSAQVNITSNQAGPVLQMSGSGSMHAATNLTVTTNGDVLLGGTMSSGSNLTLQTVSGGIALSGDLTAGAAVSLSTQGGNITR